MPTKLVEAMVSDRPALLSMDRVAVEGGVPILFRGQNSAALVFPACNPLTMPRSHKPRRPPSKACWLSKADRIALKTHGPRAMCPGSAVSTRRARSEEHTSELQSLMRISYAVFCLKKKNQQPTPTHTT